MTRHKLKTGLYICALHESKKNHNCFFNTRNGIATASGKAGGQVFLY